jgi:hypothetical protein
MKKIKVLSTVFALLAIAATASAAEFIAPSKDSSDKNVSTLQNETHKNLYTAGAAVTINGKTLGDLFAAGGMVTINGDVQQDLNVAGGNLNINSNVGSSAHIAGGNISINSPVASDLFVAGGNITISQKATVGGDLIGAGGNLSIDSNVNGNAKLGGGYITINGTINGNLDVVASQGLTFGRTSKVSGTITYRGPKKAVVDEGAKVGTINFIQIHPRSPGHFLLGFFLLTTLIKILALLVLALVLAWLLPNKTKAVVKYAMTSPWIDLGIGALILIVSPILGVILMITIVGFYIGIAVFLIYLLLLILTSALMFFYIGNLIWSWYDKNAQPHMWRNLLIGFVACIILSFIPFIGWLAILIVWLITLGALATHFRKETALLS